MGRGRMTLPVREPVDGWRFTGGGLVNPCQTARSYLYRIPTSTPDQARPPVWRFSLGPDSCGGWLW